MLEVPETVNQISAVLPDGGRDPANGVDCGEACVSSVVQTLKHYEVAPGCLRQSLKLPGLYVGTTAENLAYLLSVFGVKTKLGAADDGVLWSQLKKLRRSNRYALLLGYWVSPLEPHWVVAYERTARLVRVMNPWPDAPVVLTRKNLAMNLLDSQVWVYS